MILLDKGCIQTNGGENYVDAAARLRGTEKTTDAGVSVDGTWQRKRFSSTLGVVTAISIDSGKVLHVASYSFQIMQRLHKYEKNCPF